MLHCGNFCLQCKVYIHEVFIDVFMDLFITGLRLFPIITLALLAVLLVLTSNRQDVFTLEASSFSLFISQAVTIQ